MKSNKGWFKKGHQLTKKQIERTQKMGLANKGRKRTEEFKKNISIKNKGKLLGKKHPQWKGGRYVNKKGYVFIYSPKHPFKTKMGYVLEHRLIMEKKIKRYLGKEEVVHHKNHNPADNRIENLMLINKIEHNRLHHIGKRTKLRGKYIYTSF